MIRFWSARSDELRHAVWRGIFVVGLLVKIVRSRVRVEALYCCGCILNLEQMPPG